MHFVIISVNRDNADLFIGDKSALAQMSCVDTQTRAQIHTHTRAHTDALALICNASNMWNTLRGKATYRNQHASLHSVSLWLFLLFLLCTLAVCFSCFYPICICLLAFIVFIPSVLCFCFCLCNL